MASSSSTIASITRSQSGEVGELGREREPRDGGVALRLLELSLLDLAGEEVLDPVARPLAELRRHLAADGLEAGLDAELRDAGAHRAEPDDADRAHSATAAILAAARSRRREVVEPRVGAVEHGQRADRTG